MLGSSRLYSGQSPTQHAPPRSCNARHRALACRAQPNGGMVAGRSHLGRPHSGRTTHVSFLGERNAAAALGVDSTPLALPSRLREEGVQGCFAGGCEGELLRAKLRVELALTRSARLTASDGAQVRKHYEAVLDVGTGRRGFFFVSSRRSPLTSEDAPRSTE